MCLYCSAHATSERLQTTNRAVLLAPPHQSDAGLLALSSKRLLLGNAYWKINGNSDLSSAYAHSVLLDDTAEEEDRVGLVLYLCLCL
jgi:hypothetical protein